MLAKTAGSSFPVAFMSSRDLFLLASGAATGYALAVALRYLRARTSKVYVLVDFNVKSDHAADWRAAILAHVKASRAEDGCTRFQMHRPCHPPSSLAAPDRDVYTLVEEWESAAALKAHAATPHYLQYGPVLGKSAAVTVTKLVPI